MALAIAILCFCPPDNWRPRCPTCNCSTDQNVHLPLDLYFSSKMTGRNSSPGTIACANWGGGTGFISLNRGIKTSTYPPFCNERGTLNIETINKCLVLTGDWFYISGINI